MTRRHLALPPERQSPTKRILLLAVFSLPCLCWMLAGAAPTTAAKQTDDARELALKAPVERELRGSETHVYKIPLAAGTYLRLLITPRDGRVESKLLAPGGSEDVGVYYQPTEQGLRFVSLVAVPAGSYRLEIRLAEGAEAGRYEVKIEELRPATEQDHVRIAAEKVEFEGRIVLNKKNPQWRQGIVKYVAALALVRKLGDEKGEFRLLGFLGNLYFIVGEHQTALEYFKQTIQIARATGDRYQEANLILGFGGISLSLGEYQKALDSMNQARLLFKGLSKRYGEAIAVQNIGLTLMSMGEWQNALPHLEEALPTFSSVGDHTRECSVLNAMGTIHGALGDRKKGIELHYRALEIARMNHNMEVEPLSLNYLGNAYLELGDKQKAVDFYEQSLKISRSSGHPKIEGDALKMIGDVAYLSGDYQKALDFLNQSLNLFRSIWERAAEAKTLHSLAQVNYALGNFDEARKQIEQALDIQESLRSNIISKQLRETIFSSAQSSFALYIDLLMQLHKKNPIAGHDKSALQASERARARGLLEVLSESQADIRQGVSKNLLELERSLQQQINAKAASRTSLLSDKRTQAQSAFFDKEIAELTARFHEAEAQIRQSSPRYAALTQPQPLTASEIQQALDDDTVLLEFALGDKQSWLWAVTRTAINSYQLPASSQLEPQSRKLYELLTARQPKKGESEAQYQTRIAEADLRFQEESANLSRMLFGQITTRLQREWKGKRLAIVAPGALEYIPFAALPVPGGEGKSDAGQTGIQVPQTAVARQPLIAEHEIINLPSASALVAIRTEAAGRKPAEKTVAVLADPVFEATDSRLLKTTSKASGSPLAAGVRSSGAAPMPPEAQASAAPNPDLMRSLRNFNLSNERGGFSRLPYSREEAEAIAALAPKNSLMKALDFQATRTTAANGELSHYRIIHFATHGLLNSEQPELSGLVLSLVDESGKPQDGFLRMHEIYNLQLPADLIVLSACQTALGKQIKGEGLVGLTRGFMYAGAQRVVASLWQVDDLATAELMKSFYRGMLKDGLRPAAALRAAQLETSRQKRWSSPFFWAAFTIQGEWK